MTTEDAKTYLSKREIPRLFESLMTGLMYHRPSDHIKYLIDCLQKCHEKGQENITWSSFVDIRRTKTPLPPIHDKKRPGSKEGSRPSSKTRQAKEEPTPRDSKSSPLPDIPRSTEKASLPDVPIVLVMGAPGTNKESHIDTLLKRYPGWRHLNMGTLIKEEIQNRGEAHTKWKLTRDLISRGEPASEEVTIEVLMVGLSKCASAKGIIITGFPRSMEQVSDFESKVGRVDVTFMIDCEESASTDKLLRKGKNSNRPEDSMTAIANKMNFFKAHTLAAAKHFDDQGKLVVVEGDADDTTICYEIGKAFDKLFFSKYGKEPVGNAPPKSASSSIPEASTYKGKYEKEDSIVIDDDTPMYEGAVPEPPVIAVEDTGRKPGLPQCPIIFVAGGPGSGKGTQCGRIVQRYPDLVHLSMGDIIRTEISTKGTADDKWSMVSQLVSKGEMAPEEVTIELLKEQLLKHKDAKGFLIEGFPRDKNQVEAFNKHIGGLNFVMLFDCDEYYMKTRLTQRGRDSGRIDDNMSAIANRIKFYKNTTIPLMKTFDDQKKLVVRNIADINADRDMDEMFFEISNLFDFAFFGKQGEPPASKTQGDDQALAATKIQAGFRGYMVRNKGKAEKRAKTNDDDDKDTKKESDDH